ncbi:MAG: AmmeMemoRadiSam system protein B [Sulfurimonas sp.]|nr:MAG: AmmeMemoRadiSam system protein B [Sulfurimonas sp.]
MIRKCAVRGTFYPAECDAIEAMITQWNAQLDTHLNDTSIWTQVPRAVIVPHAGYVYSGFTANIAYRALHRSHAKRVIVIGPSHYVGIEGVSVIEAEAFETPCGMLRYDNAYARHLKAEFDLTYVALAHEKEHSTETQMPLIYHYLPHSSVVELIYGHEDYRNVAALCMSILQDPQNVLVISTDLSHFYTQNDAKALDNICLEAILARDNSVIEQGCEACGMIGVKALLDTAKQRNYHVKLLDYRTSADASGDLSRVVGYVSAAFFE